MSMFGFYDPPWSRNSFSNVDRKITRKVQKMMEDMEFSRRLSEFIKEQEKKDKEKKDDKKKEEPKASASIEKFFAAFGILTLLGPAVGLLQLHLLYWLASAWQNFLPK